MLIRGETIKKIIYILLIFTLAIGIADVTETMLFVGYTIPDNIVESDDFRMMNISADSLVNIASFSKKNNLKLYQVLSTNFVYDKCRFDKFDLSYKDYHRISKQIMKNNANEYSKVTKAFNAIFSDLQYFPVAKSSMTNYWVGYENSFGDKRSFKGEYKHEGTDIMAQNNVSGYYPVISATDGIIENIGWLPKGGYRVGVRSPSGGYFYYAHLSSYSSIKKGDKIKAGTLLGYMGDTGYSNVVGTTGNFDVHLHFGIYIKTENYYELSINPYYILKYMENKLIIANY